MIPRREAATGGPRQRHPAPHVRRHQRRVIPPDIGVVGNGATGIQVIQTIAPQVGHLTVFQRTATYAIPEKDQSTVL